MKLYTYESRKAIDLVFETKKRVIAIEEWTRKSKFPDLSQYQRHYYKNLKAYEEFNYNSEKEYVKTHIGDLHV